MSAPSGEWGRWEPFSHALGTPDVTQQPGLTGSSDATVPEKIIPDLSSPVAPPQPPSAPQRPGRRRRAPGRRRAPRQLPGAGLLGRSRQAAGKLGGGTGGRLARRHARKIGVFAALAALIGIGFATGFGSESSAEPVVEQFLLDWEQGHYTAAAQLTTGDPAQVSRELEAAYVNLDATGTSYAMTSVQQRGSKAQAGFTATLNIAGGGHQWTYRGRFALVSQGGHWLVRWAPSVIEPDLGAGDRLAVVSTLSPRAQVTDSSGNPLIPRTTVHYVGVYPGKLANVRATATAFSAAMDLNGEQVLGQISAAPPQQFLSLVTLDSASYAAKWPALAKIPGLVAHTAQARLFNPDSYDGVGDVEAENSPELHAEGAAYQPGATIGRSGLEETYQDALTGTPDVAVIVVNSQGTKVSTLWTSPGIKGSPVRTTISDSVQSAADSAVSQAAGSAEIAAVDASSGKVLALAGRDKGKLALPPGGLSDGHVAPGLSFTIITSAALLADGLSGGSPLACPAEVNVGGQSFSYDGAAAGGTLSSDFAAGCGTAFAAGSQRLSEAKLTTAGQKLGIGRAWNLGIPGFSGSSPAASGAAGLASQATGGGGVQVSPLVMALAAAEVDSGTGHTPSLVPSGPPASWAAPLSTAELNELRGLLRDAVESGPAQAANLPGTPVYGQLGEVQTGHDAWLSWFVGYRGSVAFSVLETGSTASEAAASVTAAFLSAFS